MTGCLKFLGSLPLHSIFLGCHEGLWFCLHISPVNTCVCRNGVLERCTSILRCLPVDLGQGESVWGTFFLCCLQLFSTRMPCLSFRFWFCDELTAPQPPRRFANCNVELLPGPGVAELEYTDDVALLRGDPQVVQVALNHLASEASSYGVHLTSSKRKLLLQDWQGDLPTVVCKQSTALWALEVAFLLAEMLG